MNTEEEIIREIKHLEIDCPDCIWMEDEQYTCTTCWYEGGNGRINVYEWLSKHKEQLQEQLNQLK